MLLGKIDGLDFRKDIKIKCNKKEIKPDKIIKLALLIVLAGYNKGREITLKESLKTNNKEISSFTNFILNHKKFAPIKYHIHIQYSNLSKNNKIINKKFKNQVVILGSGGLDSTGAILSFLDKGIKPNIVFLHFGQINNNREEKIIKGICNKFSLDLTLVKINIAKEVLRGWKEWSYIVPARNFLISSLGALNLKENQSYGKIVLATTQEEINHPKATPDKSKRFYRFCSKFYSREYDRKMEITTPFKDMTKPELISIWRRRWTKKYDLSPYITSTCYYGIECGKCNSCFKRSISLLAGGMNLDKKIKSNPFEYDKDKSLNYINRSLSKEGNFTEKRKLDTIIGYIIAVNKNIIYSTILKNRILSIKNELIYKLNKRAKVLDVKI